jgi:Zn-dependent protease
VRRAVAALGQTDGGRAGGQWLREIRWPRPIAPARAAAEDAMKWSWTLGRVAGIDIRIHATFLLLLAWFAAMAWFGTGTAQAALRGLLLVVAVFGCVVLHELGHALTARRFGVATRDITLLPIGGVARLRGMPRDPRAEMLIAVAGPAVNLLIAASLWIVLQPFGGAGTLAAVFAGEAPFLATLLWLNLILALFNMIPAFPMDGGRVLRAALTLRLGLMAATRVAARIGQALAAGFMVLGALYNPILMLAGVFVWFGATLEAADAQMRSALHGVPLPAALIRDFRKLDPDDSLAAAAALTLATTQKDFPVVRDGRVLGVLPQAALLAGLAEDGEHAPVRSRMRRDVPLAELSDPLPRVWDRLREGDLRLIPVLDRGELVGLIDVDNLLELSQIQAALRQRRD